MMYNNTIYDKKEEFWNVLTHGFGLILSIIAFFLLMYFSINKTNIWYPIGFAIYGFSLIVLYLASTLYHMSTNHKLRYRLNIFDHSAIYVLIAGTYTPLMLITLHGAWGWSLLSVIWLIAIVGVILKIFFIGKYEKIETWAYVVMGWLAIIAIYPLIQNLSLPGLLWLLAGGILYTIGAFLYQRTQLAYNHTVFHVFVLLGSFSHFLCIFLYV